MSEDSDDPVYEVGYGKPPKRTRFKKGRSGNPKGRPKGAKGVKACLKRELKSRITIQEGGRRITVSKAEALSKRIVTSALSGDKSAMMQLVKIDPDLFGDVQSEASGTGTETQALTPEPADFEILRDHLLSQPSDDENGTIEDWEIDDWQYEEGAQGDDSD